MVPTLLVEILVILLLILANGFFAGAEIAIITARRGRLQQLAEAGDRKAQLAVELAQDPNRFLPTVQVGITLIGTFAAAFGGARLVGYLADWLATIAVAPLVEYREAIALAVVALSITFVSLVLGELVPKRLALSNAEGLARFVAFPMSLLARFARPVVWVMGVTTDAVLSLLGRRHTPAPAVSLEDIQHMIETGRSEGLLELAEQRVALEALRLGERSVREIMRPRIDIDALDVETPPQELIGTVAMAGFSRLPVYQGSLDHIVGFVHIKDLFRQQYLGWPLDLRKLLRPPLFVPETLPVDRLLEIFQEEHARLAIVLDEYGGTEGMVTLEDVLEELVGEIRDEHRRDREQEIVRRDATSWLVDGRVSVADLVEHLGVPPAHATELRGTSTVAGLILARLERIPQVGDRARWNGLELEVVDMDGQRIDRVLVSLVPRDAGPQNREGEAPAEPQHRGKAARREPRSPDDAGSETAS